MALPNILRSLAASLLFVSALSSPARAQETVPKFDSLFVFGDSLVDVGNVWQVSRALRSTPAPPPSESPNLTYWLGRFSNGPVSVEYLWQRLSGKLPGAKGALRPYVTGPAIAPNDAVDFAFGGTGTPAIDQTPAGLYAPGLKGQVGLFAVALAGRKPSGKALYVIVTGANDYRTDAYNVPLHPAQVVDNITDAVRRLCALGAREVLVLSLPDLGQTPYLDPADAALRTAVSDAHNALLEPALASLGAQVPGSRIRFVDVNALFHRLRGTMNAQLAALDVLLPPIDPVTPIPMSACLFVQPSACRDVPGGNFDPPGAFLFWDIAHPTTDAHRQLGDYLYDQLRR
jgi:phospholipase/lecithinase/hemolysin